MIATKVHSVYDVELPDEIKSFLASMSLTITLGFQSFATTPLECVGASGYQPRLLFWMLFIPFLLVLVILAFALMISVGVIPRGTEQVSARGRHTSRPEEAYLSNTKGLSCLGAAFERSTPYLLQILFLCYPVVTNCSFEVCRPRSSGPWYCLGCHANLPEQ